MTSIPKGHNAVSQCEGARAERSCIRHRRLRTTAQTSRPRAQMHAHAHLRVAWRCQWQPRATVLPAAQGLIARGRTCGTSVYRPATANVATTRNVVKCASAFALMPVCPFGADVICAPSALIACGRGIVGQGFSRAGVHATSVHPQGMPACTHLT